MAASSPQIFIGVKNHSKPRNMQRSVENTKHEHTSVTHAVQVCESGTERDAQIQPKKLTTHERRALVNCKLLSTTSLHVTDIVIHSRPYIV